MNTKIIALALSVYSAIKYWQKIAGDRGLATGFTSNPFCEIFHRCEGCIIHPDCGSGYRYKALYEKWQDWREESARNTAQAVLDALIQMGIKYSEVWFRSKRAMPFRAEECGNGLIRSCATTWRTDVVEFVPPPIKDDVPEPSDVLASMKYTMMMEGKMNQDENAVIVRIDKSWKNTILFQLLHYPEGLGDMVFTSKCGHDLVFNKNMEFKDLTRKTCFCTKDDHVFESRYDELKDRDRAYAEIKAAFQEWAESLQKPLIKLALAMEALGKISNSRIDDLHDSCDLRNIAGRAIENINRSQTPVFRDDEAWIIPTGMAGK